MKLTVFILSLLLATTTFAALSPFNPEPKASVVMIPVNQSGQMISLLRLSNITRADYEKLSGKKLNLLDRLSFSIGQKKLRKAIKADGTIDAAKVQKMFRPDGLFSTFHLGGFLLGLFLGPIGVLIAYLINDDYKDDRVRWAWSGMGLFAGILLLVYALLSTPR